MDSTAVEIKRLQREIDKIKKDVALLKQRSGVSKTRSRKGKTEKATSRSSKKQVRDEHLRSLFGSVDLGYPLGLSNEDIDQDLAREYGSNHEAES